MRFTRKEKTLLEAALSMLYWQEYQRLTNSSHDADTRRIEHNIADINELRIKIWEGQEHGEPGDLE